MITATATLDPVVVDLLRDAEQRERLSGAGRVTAQRYAWPVVTQQIVDYYQAHLNAPDAREPARHDRSLRLLASRVAGWFDPRQL